MLKKRLMITLLLASLFFSVSPPGHGAATDSIEWVSYDDAKNLANNSNKVFLYFYSTQCYYCGLMERNTFSNSTVTQYMNQNFLPVKVNSDKQKTLSKYYNIRGNPTNYFLTEEFEVIGQLPGYLPPKDLLNILKYIHTESFKKMTLKEFVKKSTR